MPVVLPEIPRGTTQLNAAFPNMAHVLINVNTYKRALTASEILKIRFEWVH